MKFILISDIHGTSKSPKARNGNIISDFYKKIRFVFDYAQKEKAHIISAGDVFDSPRDITILYKFLFVRMKYPEVLFFTIFGQHDLYFRNKSLVTNLGILKRSKLANILNSKPYKINNINLYGCSWGEKVPEIKRKDKLNILSIHAPITYEPLFYGHEIEKNTSWVNKHDFDLTICGDIHRSFILYNKQRTKAICNTGPTMRLDTSSYTMQHEPKFYLYNTETKNIETVIIPHEKSNLIFDTTIKEAKQEINLQGFDFIDPKTQNIDTVIFELISKSKNPKKIMKIISEISGDDEWMQ